MSKRVKRLAEQFLPANYNLTLDIDTDAMTSVGHVTIQGRKIGRPSKRLTFHINGPKVTTAKVIKIEKTGKRDQKISRINHHKTLHEVRLHFTESIFPGEYIVELEFKGKINETMLGMYACNYKHDGKDKKLIATQFESHHAREAFPCIDEPIAKATFDLTLITDANVTALSNMQPKSEKTNKNRKTTIFDTSPIMSSYLLAWVVGEIHCVEGKSKNGILVRSWATVAQKPETLEYANSEAIQVLDFFEDYFDVPFPLEKVDQVALPDFESGAMENWGLVTYRESVLLDDPTNPSNYTRQVVSMVIAHELSHQWFGNLVTMKWWDDLWLNESFAALMEHIPLTKLHPDWHQREQYTAYDIPLCSGRDVYSDVQNVGMGVNHPDEINSLFDPAIVYAKGGRLIKMLRQYIGDDDFRKALKLYFKKHAYKNTFRDDLWDAMSEASGKDIKALMTPWLVQSGMPVIKVEKLSDNKRRLTQERFILDKENDQSIWPIPLLSDDKTTPELLDKKSLEFESDGLPLFNKIGAGHYLVHYSDGSDFKHIIDKITSKPEYAEARVNTLNDLILLASRGDTSLVNALELVKTMPNEPRDAVWLLMTRALGLSSNLGENNKIIEDGLKKFRYELAKDNYAKLGWDDLPDDDVNTKQLRATTIALMLGAENQDVINKAKSVYDSAKSIEDIPSDRRSLVLGTVIKHKHEDSTIRELIDIYKDTNDPDVQQAIASGLTSTKLPEVANILVSEGLSDKGFVRPQDVFRWYAYLMRNKHTREVAWDWLTNNWDLLEKNYGKALDHFIIYSSGPINTPQGRDKFNKFFDPMIEKPGLTRNINIAHAEIDARIAWRIRELKPLEDFFKSLQ